MPGQFAGAALVVGHLVRAGPVAVHFAPARSVPVHIAPAGPLLGDFAWLGSLPAQFSCAGQVAGSARGKSLLGHLLVGSLKRDRNFVTRRRLTCNRRERLSHGA